MTPFATRAARWFAPALSLAVVAGMSTAPAAQDVGYKGPSIDGSGPTTGSRSVTESKPQNKVWFNDNKWYASMWSSSALAFRIHKLDQVTHQWSDTGLEIDARRDSHSDALLDGNRLYIVSHEFASGSKLGRPIILQRYTYANGSFVQDAGFPVTIGDSSSESVSIERDSTGKLFAVWKQGLRVYYNFSLASDTVWSTPAPLPGATTDFDNDDICAIQRFGGNKIGVMWNDNVQADFLFAVHTDGQDPAVWSANEVAWDGQSDDHINLAADSAGNVYAAVKNDNEDVVLLVRSPAGVWANYLVSDDTLTNRLSRPIVLLNEQNRTVQIFASYGGAIYTKSTSMDAIAFTPGLGTMVMRDADGVLSDPTSTRQNINASTGLVVLAANLSPTGNYYHHEVAPVPTGPAAFTMSAPLPGTAGVQNIFGARGCTPNTVVTFVASINTGTASIVRPTCPAGIPTQLGNPMLLLGTAKANAAGIAAMAMVVPAGSAGKTYHFQAVEITKCRASTRISEQF